MPGSKIEFGLFFFSSCLHVFKEMFLIKYM